MNKSFYVSYKNTYSSKKNLILRIFYSKVFQSSKLIVVIIFK